MLLWEEVKGLTVCQWIQVSCSCEGHRGVSSGHRRTDVSWLAPDAIGLLASLGMRVLSLVVSHWFYRHCGNIVNDEGGNNCIQSASVLRCRERCWLRTGVGFHSWCVCSERHTQGGAFQAGFCCIIFSEMFSLLPYWCWPAMISGKATGKTKKELFREQQHSFVYGAMMKEVHPRLPTALWLMRSCPPSVKALPLISCCHYRMQMS